MQVSFIIPLYNCLALTQAMLASLHATIPREISHEIILVDDGSNDGTRAWLTTLPSPCRVILNETNLGFAGACNRGAASAHGEFIFFLNNDLVLSPGWMEPMLAAFSRFSAVGLVGNVQRNAATGAIDHAGVYFDHKCKPVHTTQVPLSTRCFGRPAYRAVPALTGACMGLRRSTWEKLGGFDEGFRNGGEDVDLGLRALAAGLVNYVALTSIVRHHISQSAGRKLRDEQNSARLAARWREKILSLSARAWSRQQIITHADQSHVFDYAMVQAASIHFLAQTEAPAAVREGVAHSFAIEAWRWNQLLHGEPPPPLDLSQRTDVV